MEARWLASPGKARQAGRVMVTTPPESEPPVRISPVRAVLVMAGFVIAVGALVAIGTRPSTDRAAVASVTTTTVAPSFHTPPTTTTTTEPHHSVTVLVANATTEAMLAAHYSTLLGAQGWGVVTPVDAATTVATSAVYYAAGQQGAADAIATTLGLKPAAVLPLTTAVPVAGASGNDVVVVIGADLVTQAAT